MVEKSLTEKYKEYLKKRQKEISRKIRKEIKRKEEEKKKFLKEILSGAKNVKILLLETRKYDYPWGTVYTSVVRIKDGDYVSHPFNIDYKDEQEFKRKLKLEILRYLSLKRKLGLEVVSKLW